jgi:DNA-binding transcriptional LysR family regulator
VQIEAVWSGVGIGMFPDYMATGEPHLIALLPNSLAAERSYWIAMHSDLCARITDGSHRAFSRPFIDEPLWLPTVGVR